MGKGITLGQSQPPQTECFICLLKAIENKKDVEYYYNEYWKNNVPKEVVISDKPDNILY